MIRNRSVVGAEWASWVGAGLGYVYAERATGLDERRQKRDHSPPVGIGAGPDAGQTVGHCGSIQYGGRLAMRSPSISARKVGGLRLRLTHPTSCTTRATNPNIASSYDAHLELHAA